MVKWLLLIVFALVMMVAIVLGGGFAFVANVKTDVNDPKFAAKFQETMTGLCVQQAKGEIRGAGQNLDYQQEAMVKQVCDCDMKAITKIIAKKGAKTPVEIQAAVNESGHEMNVAFNSCAQAYGLQ